MSTSVKRQAKTPTSHSAEGGCAGPDSASPRKAGGGDAGSVAAVLSEKAKGKPGEKVVTRLSGGKVDFERLKSII